MNNLTIIDKENIVFDGFKKEARLNSFTMSPTKWI